jgi:hypothetical protein
MNALQKNCLLVTMTARLPGKSKKDRDITAKVLAEENASPDAGRFVKTLYPSQALEKAEQAANAARTYLYSRTLPWQDNGTRLLPAALMLELQTTLNKYGAQFTQAADESANNYDAWLSAAQQRHAGMYRREDYPADRQEFRALFGLRVQFTPLPDAANILLDLAQAEIDAIRQGTAQAIKDAADQARAEVLRRLAEPAAAALERLSQPRAIFRDSLIDNMREAAALAPALNVTKDPLLDGLADELKQVAQHRPDTIRTAPSIRSATAARAARLLEKIKEAQATPQADDEQATPQADDEQATPQADDEQATPQADAAMATQATRILAAPPVMVTA